MTFKNWLYHLEAVILFPIACLIAILVIKLPPKK